MWVACYNAKMITSPKNTPLYLEDMFVGRKYASDTFTMEADQIIAFAKMFDPQPFHTDPEAAKKSLFGTLVASGWHTASITMRLLVTTGVPIGSGLIGLEGAIAWPKPVYPG